MEKTLYLSHFTPSMMDPAVLEAIFVQREDMLDRAQEHIIASIETESKHQSLFVGPRGIGKTHFLSLLNYRLARNKNAQRNALIAWMREEEWGVTSFLELVLRILKTLNNSYPKLKLHTQIDAIYALKPKAALASAEALLLKTLDKKTLVLFIENLDDLFGQLKTAEQQNWRAFMQNHPVCTIVATSPALFSGVSLQNSPFYGFFRTETLRPLEFEGVITLLKKIAQCRGDSRLAGAIGSSHGRARLRAIHHLAEGNPRIYIIFAQFLTEQSLDSLVDAFMHTLDELTPYYQARMKELSGQQRKIVEYLCDYRGAAPVKDIAKACFITHQTCSSQLKELKDKCYAKSKEIGRESYYELAEPLMRICLDVKKQRGEPIGLFVKILRIWYTQPELTDWMARLGERDGLEKSYIAKALELAANDTDDPKITPLQTDFEEVYSEKNFGKCEEILADWLAVEAPPGIAYWAADWRLSISIANYDRALEAARKMREMVPPLGIISMLITLDFKGDPQGIIDLVGENDVVEDGLTDKDIGFVYGIRGGAFTRLKQYDKAAKDLVRACRANKAHIKTWLQKQIALYKETGDGRRALQACRRLVKFDPDSLEWLLTLSELEMLYGSKDKMVKTLHLMKERFPNKTLSRYFHVLQNRSNDFEWIKAADDYSDWAKYEIANSFLFQQVGYLVERFNAEEMSKAIRILLNNLDEIPEGQLGSLMHTIYLMQERRSSDVMDLLHRFAIATRTKEVEASAAILSTLRWSYSRDDALTHLDAWYDALVRTFRNELEPSSMTVHSLDLVHTFIDWKRSGKEQVLMRLPEEERKLLTEMVTPAAVTTKSLPH